MLSRIVAEHASQAIASVARLKASRAAGPAPAARSAGTGKSGLSRNGPPGGVLRTDHVVAYAEQEPEGSCIPFSEHAARGPIDGDLPRHQIGAWMIVEGGGDNRGEG
jgi:hypothetical protein